MKTLAFCRVLRYNVCIENREMQTSNTAEMVTISRAEYERFQEQAQVITSLTLQTEWLLEQLKLSKKKLFGCSSEQAEQMVMEQLSFTYNEAEAYASGTKAAAEKPVAVKAHERKRQSGNVLDVVPEGIKQTLEVRTFDGQRVPVMAYIMNPELHLKPSLPPRDYYLGIKTGYEQNGLPVGCLKYAFKNCLKECGMEPYPKKVQTKPPQRKETGYER